MYMWMRMTFDHVWWGAKHSPMRSVPDINVWEHNPEPCIKGWGNPKINHGIGQAHRPRLTFLTVAISDNLPSHHDEWVDVCVFILVCVCVIGGYDVYDHITCFVHPCGHFLSVLMEVPSVRAVLFCVSVDIFSPMLSHLSGIRSFCRPESDIAH